MMSTRQEFASAQKTLVALGYELIGTMAVDDARKEGVENFGMSFLRYSDKAAFWLNYKTIDRVKNLI